MALHLHHGMRKVTATLTALAPLIASSLMNQSSTAADSAACAPKPVPSQMQANIVYTWHCVGMLFCTAILAVSIVSVVAASGIAER